MVATVVNVTATIGGAGQNISLNLDANDVANYNNTALNHGINPAFSVSAYYDPPNVVVNASTVVEGFEFQPLVIGSTTEAVTITGGDISSSQSQIVVASDGGLNFTGSGNTNELVLVSSGDSSISLAANTASDGVYLNSGTNTVVAGSGPTTISAGTGANSIFAGSGGTLILVQGQDSIQLAGGSSSIYVDALNDTPDNASALIYGDTNPTVKSSIYFNGEGVNASTVFGGTSGSDTLLAGAGGGYFQAGSGGGSALYAGSGAVTLVGGVSGGDTLNGSAGNTVTFVTMPTETMGDLVSTGSGISTVLLQGSADTVDAGGGQTTVSVSTGALVNAGSGSMVFIGGSAASTVVGGTGSETIFGGSGGGYFTGGTSGGNLIFAGSGAATLVGGGSSDTLVGSPGTGNDVFSFVNEAAGQSYTINAFYVTGSTTGDTLYFKNTTDEAAALASYHVSGGSGMITLQDGTKITLQGYTGSITGHTGS